MLLDFGLVMILWVVQQENIGGEEVRMVLNEKDFTILEGDA